MIHGVYESKKFKIYLLGSSYDLRTNRWEVTCKKCGRTYAPDTTMLSSQKLICKCGETEIVNYNNLTDESNIKSNNT